MLPRCNCQENKYNKRVKQNDELQEIPGIGKEMAKDLHDLGIHKISELAGKDSEQMYKMLESLHGKQDRCVLYVFRSAVYYASNKKHDPEKLKWWNWKD